MEDLSIFSQRLKEARIKAGLKQRELADKVGMTAATISAYESNDGIRGKNPSLENAKALSVALKVSLDWLCGLDSLESSRKDSKDRMPLVDFLKDIVRISSTLKSTSISYIPSEMPELPFDLAELKISFDQAPIPDFADSWLKLKSIHNQGLLDDELFAASLEGVYKKYQDYEILNGKIINNKANAHVSFGRISPSLSDETDGEVI